MNHTERLAPVAGALAALSTMLCCLPLGFAAAAVTASAGTAIMSLRPWLLGASVLFVAVGFVQLRSARACGRRSRLSAILLWTSAAVVVLALLLPQVLATLLA